MPSDRVSKALDEMVADRDWEQFHTPENLIKSISIEAGEPLECVQWAADADLSRVRDELADILTYSYMLAAKLDLDPDQIVLDKLEITRLKYPVEESHGRSVKYDNPND